MTDLEGRALGDALAEALGLEHVNLGPPWLWCKPDGRYIGKGDDLLIWAGVGLIVEALTQRGYAVRLYLDMGGGGTAEIEDIDSNLYEAGHHHVPTAVAQAAYEALTGGAA